jgi:quercetin dioxygenase-like cupin family protein
LVVSAGKLTLIFEDTPDETHVLATGDSAVIPPARPHHVVLDGPVEFSIEFHRRP